jgi:hypothetical protein
MSGGQPKRQRRRPGRGFAAAATGDMSGRAAVAEAEGGGGRGVSGAEVGASRGRALKAAASATGIDGGRALAFALEAMGSGFEELLAPGHWRRPSQGPTW